MSLSTINILLIDDHKLVSEAVALYLSNEEDFVVKTVSSLEEATAFLAQQTVDIILLDTKLPQMIGIEGVASVIEMGKGASVIIFSGTTDESFARQAVQIGASGFIPKTLSMRIIPAAIRLVRDGAIFMPFMAGKSARSSSRDGDVSAKSGTLTIREIDIVRLVQAGFTNKEIARKIESSEIKVKMYMRAIFEKLGAKNRAHSVTIAQGMGLISE